MRVDGEWLLCEDGVIRPTVPAVFRAVGGTWIEIAFLLDGGADRTVFSADLLSLLRPLETTGIEQSRDAGYIRVETAIRFSKDDDQRVTVHGPFAVFTQIESADLSILGRDVTNNFSVIYDYPNGVVALLTPPHSYEIKTK